MKWTKKDIKIMQGAISTFWLINRPLWGMQNEATQEVSSYLGDLSNRLRVVCSGIEDLLYMNSRQREEDLKTAQHFAAHPNIYGAATPEMISRFERQAADETKDIVAGGKLLDRIRINGLPPEVVLFDPTNVRRH